MLDGERNKMVVTGEGRKALDFVEQEVEAGRRFSVFEKIGSTFYGKAEEKLKGNPNDKGTQQSAKELSRTGDIMFATHNKNYKRPAERIVRENND